jgi:hypothetical protein
VSANNYFKYYQQFLSDTDLLLDLLCCAHLMTVGAGHARDQEQKNKKTQMNANKRRIFCFYWRDAQGCANAAGAATAMDGGR